MLKRTSSAVIDCSGPPVAVSAVVPLAIVSTACPSRALHTMSWSTVPLPVTLPEMSIGVGVGVGVGV